MKKIIYYDLWDFRCKIWIVEWEIRVLFERRIKFLWFISTWESIYKRAYIFSVSNKKKPNDDRPRMPSTLIDIGYRKYQYEEHYKDFDLNNRINDIANEIVDDIKSTNASIRLARKQIKQL